MSTILAVTNLGKTFQSTAHIEPVEVLKDLNMQMEAADTVAILGQSGSGKGELGLLLARLVRPSGGRITIGGHNLTDLPLVELAE